MISNKIYKLSYGVDSNRADAVHTYAFAGEAITRTVLNNPELIGRTHGAAPWMETSDSFTTLLMMVAGDV